MWLNPVTNTPSIIQVDFGSWGENVPGDGEAYCGPTSIVMGLYWLYANGFTQLAPAAFVSQDDPATVNLELVIAGLMQTSVSGGTSGGFAPGLNDYLSARGIGRDKYALSQTNNPDLEWLAKHITPKIAQGAPAIALASFVVSWYHWSEGQMLNVGGHFLTPLWAEPKLSQVILNNPFPASFAKVPNDSASNPQAVGIVAAPQWLVSAAQYLDSSKPYAMVVSQDMGQNPYAILSYGGAWSIAGTAAYAPPSVWNLMETKIINTNGGTSRSSRHLRAAAGW